MKYKALFLPLLAGFLAGGCDYGCIDSYHIVNNTSDTIMLVIHADSLKWFDGANALENNQTKVNDSTHAVYPHSEIELIHDSGICGKYYRPDDYRYDGDYNIFLGKYIKAVYTNTYTQPLDSTYWDTEKWTFESKRRMRLYQLIFNEK